MASDTASDTVSATTSTSAREVTEVANEANRPIVEEFEKLRRQIRFDMDHTRDRSQRMSNTFRLQVIDKVIDVVSKFPTKIESVDQLKGIKGIGKNTLKRIGEILETGKLGEIKSEVVTQSYLDIVEDLSEVFGIGRQLAYRLFRKYGVRSVDELKSLHEAGKVELPDVVVKGLKYHGIAKGKIPRVEIEEMDDYLHEVLLRIDPELFGIICGSYRRMATHSGDVDMLLVHPSVRTITSKLKMKVNYLETFLQHLRQDQFLVESLTAEDVTTKYMGLCRWKECPIRRIDIRFVPYDSYYTAILYFTGPKNFNRNMRRLAISLGYTLNEYALVDENGLRIPINSEKDAFDVLGMEYVPPEKRR